LGYRILITLFRVSRKKKIKKKIYVGLVITTKMYTKRKDGTFLKFFQNRVLTLSEQLKFLGTRIYGPITREIKKDEKGTLYKKIISYTSTI
jgi:large subunit ribosomal protein L14